MAKDEKESKNVEKIFDKLLERGLNYLAQSDAFEKIVLKAHKIWHDANQKKGQGIGTTAQTVDNQLAQIVEGSSAPEPQVKIVEKRVEVPVEKKRVEVPVEKIVKQYIDVPVTPEWAKVLEKQYSLWNSLKNFPKLHSIFEQTTFQQESDDLLRFISCASQWNHVIRLWESLETECRNTKMVISAEQLALLENCVMLYNLTLKGTKARLEFPQQGETYHYKRHSKLGNGETIQEVLLPSLYNSANDLVKHSIVICD